MTPTGMKWLLGTYTGRFNRRHREFGHLFSGRYQALVAAGLKRLGWTESDLQTRRKGDAGKVAVALRAKTTMPLAWIAARLRMGSRGYLTWLLQRPGSGRQAC